MSKIFCQIVGHDIKAQTCLSTQGQERCFGCASLYRLCEMCKHRPVSVSMTGLCDDCLHIRLSQEKTPVPPLQKSTMVTCQVLSRTTSVAVCVATQGQSGCRGCSEPARLCEFCKQRTAQLARLGLCLSCAVQEFAPEWKWLGPSDENHKVPLPLQAKIPELNQNLSDQDKTTPNQFSLETKIKRLEGLAKSIGDGKILSQLIREVIEDLKALEALRKNESL